MNHRMRESLINALAIVAVVVGLIVCGAILVAAWSDCDQKGGTLVKSMVGYSCIAAVK